LDGSNYIKIAIKNIANMHIELDRNHTLPIYRQIENHLRKAIENGSLKTGTKLPPIRNMASDLGINRITVETAYQYLEADGLIEKKTGSGTFVLPVHGRKTKRREEETAWPHWQFGPLGKIKIENLNRLEDQLQLEQHDSPITFSSGIGDPTLFPIEDFGKTLQRVIRRDGVFSLIYGEPNGYLPLRETISQILAARGQQFAPSDILITTGSQQAITLVSLLILKPGDTVIVENPTYSGASDLFKAFHANVIGIDMDKEGMKVESLEEQLRIFHPKLIYTIPNYNNPTGISMSGYRRRMLLDLAERYNVPILEDDYVGDLRYDGVSLPTLKSLDRVGQVIYISTFSKLLMADIRVGYIISEGPIYEKLVNLKCLNDLATPNLFQRALNAYLSVGRYQAHIKKLTRVYRKRRDFALNAVESIFGQQACRDTPKGGFFLWLGLKDIKDEKLLENNCRKNGVYFGRSYQLLSHPELTFLRMNFAAHPEANIEKGLSRLKKSLADSRC